MTEIIDKSLAEPQINVKKHQPCEETRIFSNPVALLTSSGSEYKI